MGPACRDPGKKNSMARRWRCASPMETVAESGGYGGRCQWSPCGPQPCSSEVGRIVGQFCLDRTGSGYSLPWGTLVTLCGTAMPEPKRVTSKRGHPIQAHVLQANQQSWSEKTESLGTSLHDTLGFLLSPGPPSTPASPCLLSGLSWIWDRRLGSR